MADDLFDPMDVAPTTADKPAKKKPASTSDEQDRPNNAAGAELLSYIERVERLLEEKQGIANDIKDVKGEAKAKGYDMPAFNEMIRLRAMDKDERDEREALRDHYAHALGIFG